MVKQCLYLKLSGSNEFEDAYQELTNTLEQVHSAAEKEREGTFVKDFTEKDELLHKFVSTEIPDPELLEKKYQPNVAKEEVKFEEDEEENVIVDAPKLSDPRHKGWVEISIMEVD